MYIDLVWEFIAYYNVANLVVITTKMNMIDQIACGKYNCGTNTAASIKTPTELCRGLSNHSQSLPQTSTDGLSWSWSLPHTLAESSMAPNFDYPENHITVHHQSNCKQEVVSDTPVNVLAASESSLHITRRTWSIYIHLGALVRSTGNPRKSACGF